MKSETTWTSSLIDFINELKAYIFYWDSKNLTYFVVQDNKDYYRISVLYSTYSMIGQGSGSIIASYKLSPELLTKLLDNNVIIPELSDEEYKIQYALGTVEIRKYKIDEQKLKALKC